LVILFTSLAVIIRESCTVICLSDSDIDVADSSCKIQINNIIYQATTIIHNNSKYYETKGIR